MPPKPFKKINKPKIQQQKPKNLPKTEEEIIKRFKEQTKKAFNKK
jgi:hypothetical protein